LARPAISGSSVQPVDAVTFALGHIKTSSGAETVRADFEATLASGHVRETAKLAVETHFFETGPAELASLVAEGFSSFAALCALARKILPATHPNRLFLESAAHNWRPQPVSGK
jgi:hypothetical protein